MALLTIAGEPASRIEEVAHGAAQLLGFDLVTESRLAQWLGEEFGEAQLAGRSWPPAVVSILTRLATEHHLVVAASGSESLFAALPMPLGFLLRVGVIAPEARRVGNLMLDRRVERDEARRILKELDQEARRQRKARFGRSASQTEAFDLMVNA